jgi:hypothetical protein
MSNGSRSRTFSVSQAQFGNNFDAIFRKPDPKVIEDQRNEDEAFEQILLRQETNNESSTERNSGKN